MTLCGFALMGAVAFAQSLQLNDVCGAFQHQSVAFSTASPTSKLISGASGTTIYVCKIHISTAIAYASPALTLYSGTGSTCGTGTVTEGTFGSATVAGANADIGDGAHTILNTAVGANLCSVTSGTTFGNGTIEYVQR